MLFSKCITVEIRINEKGKSIADDFENFAKKILAPNKYVDGGTSETVPMIKENLPLVSFNGCF